MKYIKIKCPYCHNLIELPSYFNSIVCDYCLNVVNNTNKEK